MSWCEQAGITDGAFEHLKGIHNLHMNGCNQAGITGRTLNELGDNLKLLAVDGCNKNTKEVANKLYGVTPDNPYVEHRRGGGKRRRKTGRKTRRKGKL